MKFANENIKDVTDYKKKRWAKRNEKELMKAFDKASVKKDYSLRDGNLQGMVEVIGNTQTKGHPLYNMFN